MQLQWLFEALALEQAPMCPQPKKIVPAHSGDVFFTPDYRNYSRDVLAGAVRIPTQSFDDMAMDPTTDDRFNGLYDFHNYLFEQFPLCAEHAQTVNTFGLVYTFKGSDSSQKPILLTGHQDTVPVNPETAYQWDYEPFGGYFDGEWLHGRGVVDCKNNVVGILEAVEYMLKNGWIPNRTLVCAFGFDEEIGGLRGASSLNTFLLDAFGPQAFEFILDEGSGQPVIDGVRIIGPFIAERGAIDTIITVDTPGGHSSQPPDHTGIGIMSALVTQLETEPLVPGIKDPKRHPAAALYQCLAEHTSSVPKSLRSTFLNITPKNLKKLVSYITERTSWMIWTSQAIDVVRGGVKINALPETVRLTTNYRVSIDSSPEEIYSHVEAIAERIAKKYNLGFSSQDEFKSFGKNGNLSLAIDRALQVAPITPWTGAQWDKLVGTMRHIFEDLVPGGPSVVAPSVMSGNTDTAYYWSLSDSIYRYSPVFATEAINKHTVNERIKLDAHLGAVAFYYELIKNFD